MERAEPFVAVPSSTDHANVSQLLFTSSHATDAACCSSIAARTRLARRQLKERHTCLHSTKVEMVLHIADCSEYLFDFKD